MDCDATHHSTNGRGWDVRGGLGSACELPCTATGRGQAPQARTEAVQERSPPAPPQGGGKPQKRFTSDGPAPPQGGGKPRPYYTRASQAVSSYSRGDPCGRPEMGALLQSALCSRVWGQAPPLLYTGLAGQSCWLCVLASVFPIRFVTLATLVSFVSLVSVVS